MTSEIPKSMSVELGAWNNGAGIPLETWVECEGNFKLAVGYAALLWPTFETIGKYILVEGSCPETIAGFEEQADSTPQRVEAVLNHLHISDLHMNDEEGLSADKFLFLGNRLKEIYEAKLCWQFPERPCEVKFFVPDDPEDFRDYQVTFWQKAWEDGR